MNLYVFASSSVTNIWAGVGAGIWAAPIPTGKQEKSIRTKASRMQPGDCGVIYCSASQSLTTPFIVYSEPDQTRLVDDVWPETWALPFRIRPLGNPTRQMHKDMAMRTLEVCRNSGKANITHVLHIPQPTAFSPNEVPTADWSRLVSELAT